MLERVLLAVVAAFLLAGTAFAQPQSSVTEITQLRVERAEEGVLLSTAIRFDLPPVIEEALDKGIPMFFVAEASLFKDRWYWYDKQIAHAERHMRLSYQPLTRRWRLVVSNAPIGPSSVTLGQNFETREEALAAVQHLSHWKVAETTDVESDGKYSVEFRFRLDISQLPRPFQIGAVGHADWNIGATRSLRLTIESIR